MKGRPTHQRLRFALCGIATGFRREASFRAHVALAAAALALLLAARPGAGWWALFGVVAGLVMACELMNSALEALVDLLHPDWHSEIKAIKDMMSGAVMLAGFAALAVAAAFVAREVPLLAAWWRAGR